MTRNSNFKRLVRERMASTGERYATARSQILAKGTEPKPNRPQGIFEAVSAVGGQQPDLAAARNLCTNAGVRGPNGQPLSEAMAFGLAGGIGFLYGVFEYGDQPTMTIVARNKSMPDPFCEPLFAAAGATTSISTTGSARKAAAGLDQAIDAGQPVLCTVGAGALAYLGSCEGLAPHLVGVVGASGDEVLVDDRSPSPIRLRRSEFDQARAAYAKGKHRMITITDVAEQDWDTAIRSAIEKGVAGYNTPPVPQFASNVGLAGLDKFHRLLTTPNDKKSWHRVFGDGRRAAIGLSRLHDCIDYAYTAPSAGRPLYAEFLDECGPQYAEAAELFRASGQHWDQVAAIASGTHPNLAAHAARAEERAMQLDATDGPDLDLMARAASDQTDLIDGSDISSEAAAGAYAAIAEHVKQLIVHETNGLALLQERVARP